MLHLRIEEQAEPTETRGENLLLAQYHILHQHEVWIYQLK